MIVGAHAVVYSADAEADRAFLRDVLGLPHVDAGHGWLIFALPPSEVAVHPAEASGRHELHLMVDDVRAFVREMRRRKVRCSAIREQPWGSLTRLRLPGGGEVGVYQPTHPRPAAGGARKGARRSRGK
ncbi:MAG TPA: hypothetical protein VFP65_17605 [Anaeromyxobacteraceae bacterium]|nr:hypothetical protein [Anaeromyxobacteraceae bacterium]